MSTDPELVPQPPRPGRAPSASACEPYREVMAEALDHGRHAMAIWQDLVDAHGCAARDASVRRFVLTLGCSRTSVRRLVWRSNAQIWAEWYERAVRRLGGTVRVIVLDNLREGVLSPDVYDPTRNPLDRDVLAPDGVVARPCRVGGPDRKGKVDAGVGHAQQTPLHGLRFETLDEAQASLDRWETRWADTRIHRTTTRHVAVMCAEAQPALARCRSSRFGMTTTANAPSISTAASKSRRRDDGAPPGWLGHRVPVPWNDRHVRRLAPKTGQLLREHLRAPRGWHRIHEDDRPARPPRRTLALLAAAKTAGPHISAVCDSIHAHEGVSGVRRMLGVLALAKQHGPAVVDDAANAALDLGVPTSRFLRRYLERRPPVPLTRRQVDPLIRQLTRYRDLIDRKTGDPT